MNSTEEPVTFRILHGFKILLEVLFYMLWSQNGFKKPDGLSIPLEVEKSSLILWPWGHKKS